MKKAKKKTETEDEMRAEYDFSGGVRGQHYRNMREGYTVTVNRVDGTTLVQNFKLEDGAVRLDRDVQEFFPDSESVNNALRGLIALLPQKSRKSKLSVRPAV
jgi:hypothetical protein